MCRFVFITIEQCSVDRKWSGRERGGRDQEKSLSWDAVTQQHYLSAHYPLGQWLATDDPWAKTGPPAIISGLRP